MTLVTSSAWSSTSQKPCQPSSPFHIAPLPLMVSTPLSSVHVRLLPHWPLAVLYRAMPLSSGSASASNSADCSGSAGCSGSTGASGASGVSGVSGAAGSCSTVPLSVAAAAACSGASPSAHTAVGSRLVSIRRAINRLMMRFFINSPPVAMFLCILQQLHYTTVEKRIQYAKSIVCQFFRCPPQCGFARLQPAENRI